MKINMASICFAGIALLGITKLVNIERTAPLAPASTRITKINRVAAGPLTVDSAEILGMGPTEWQQRFDKKPKSTNASTRKTVMHLSEDLQKMLTTGVDPQGEEAGVYVDAIQSLLESDVVE